MFKGAVAVLAVASATLAAAAVGHATGDSVSEELSEELLESRLTAVVPGVGAGGGVCVRSTIGTTKPGLFSRVMPRTFSTKSTSGFCLPLCRLPGISP